MSEPNSGYAYKIYDLIFVMDDEYSILKYGLRF